MSAKYPTGIEHQGGMFMTEELKEKGTKEKGERIKEKGQRTKDKGQRTKEKGERIKYKQAAED